ncbi:hypothetical protein ACET3Z_007865 [Daucus carota]
MLRRLRVRRRPSYASHLCAITTAILLLISVSLLHSRLTSDRPTNPLLLSNDAVSLSDHLLDDGDPEDLKNLTGSDDRIDELDDGDSDPSKIPNEDEILRGVELEDDDDKDQKKPSVLVSGYYFDHVSNVIRHAFDKKSIDLWEDYVAFDANLGLGSEDLSRGVFGSDDIPVDDNVRRKVGEVKGIEDALLLNVGGRVSPLREGWGDWFDKKGDFLRRDKMFKSNLELLNPLNNPLLQDPDGVGLTGLTRGDKMVMKGLVSEFKNAPFLIRKAPEIGNVKGIKDGGKVVESEMKVAERKTLGDNVGKSTVSERGVVGSGRDGKRVDSVVSDSGSKSVDGNVWSEFSGQVYADGKRWGYYPGLDGHLSFSNFMDAFFRKGRCSTRIFMVWNSPPWAFSVRHQRGLESLLVHNPDACVVIFSETIELNLFDGFVKDGFKVAVAMPNLDELLKDTPTHIFASVWLDWKKTKFYSTHLSELVRLASLYKYGGIYLDSDIIVLRALSSLNNTVGLENEHSESDINGAVMAFDKHSPFIWDCLTEFYSTYDDTLLRWNGAELLTRVGKSFLNKKSPFNKKMELKLQPSSAFFPISRDNITSFFTTPSTTSERSLQDGLFKKILNESVTFHFWNSLTSALIPEPDSLVAKLINHSCIRCSDVL